MLKTKCKGTIDLKIDKLDRTSIRTKNRGHF